MQSTFVLVVIWVLSLLGAGWAYVVNLASAMKTVPSMSLGAMLSGLALPVLAGLLAAWRFTGSINAGESRPWISVGIPLLVALLSAALMILSFLFQPGGPRW